MARITTAAGPALGYAAAGSGDKTPIVFLHGVGSDKSVWRRQLDHFGAERRGIAFDYPGYGESDPAPEGTTRDDYAAAILSAMTALGVERAHLCGLSLGGVVAIAVHHLSSRSCASLTLADTFAVHPEGRVFFERSVEASADLRAFAEGRVDILIAQPADPAVRTEVVETMARIDADAFRIGVEAVWLADQQDRVADIRVPTLVLCGGEDMITPPALSHSLQQLIPGAQYQEIERAGHMINIERPDAFNDRVDAFIRGVDSRPG
jgi:3-oxoadipate enol-lactonase